MRSYYRTLLAYLVACLKKIQLLKCLLGTPKEVSMCLKMIVKIFLGIYEVI